MLLNGCKGSSRYDQCTTVLNGLFSRGLHSVTQHYGDTVLSLLSRLGTPEGAALNTTVIGCESWFAPLRVVNDGVTELQARIAESEWQDVELIGSHLFESLATATDYRMELVNLHQAQFKRTIDAIGVRVFSRVSVVLDGRTPTSVCVAPGLFHRACHAELLVPICAYDWPLGRNAKTHTRHALAVP
jgi:hypothetical protein